MRKYLFLLTIITVLASCTGESTESSTPIIPVGTIPVGALQEAYEDNPDLVAVTVTNTVGVLTGRGNYYKGLKHGTWTEYWPNGLPKSVENYELGILEGASLSFENTGQLVSSINYHNGLKHGLSITYSRSNIESEMPYVKDKLHGISKSYYKDGTIMEESAYIDGKRNGISRWYDMNGNLSIEYEYRNNERVD